MIIEVSTEYDTPFAERRVCVVYHDGQEVREFPTFERAMAWAFPNWTMWDPRASCESRLDAQ